jgi:hypothetical protein
MFENARNQEQGRQESFFSSSPDNEFFSLSPSFSPIP